MRAPDPARVPFRKRRAQQLPVAEPCQGLSRLRVSHRHRHGPLRVAGGFDQGRGVHRQGVVPEGQSDRCFAKGAHGRLSRDHPVARFDAPFRLWWPPRNVDGAGRRTRHPEVGIDTDLSHVGLAPGRRHERGEVTVGAVRQGMAGDLGQQVHRSLENMLGPRRHGGRKRLQVDFFSGDELVPGPLEEHAVGNGAREKPRNNGENDQTPTHRQNAPRLGAPIMDNRSTEDRRSPP